MLDELYKQEIAGLVSDYATGVRTGYLSDALTEYADGLVPIYNHAIIDEWGKLDYDEMDAGADYAVPEDTIIRRMMYDLYNYYQNLVSQYAYEIIEEHGLEVEL